MHALAGELNMQKMGGLRKYMPVTFATMLVGTLAISGVPFFSGFFSKDEILYRSFISPQGSPILWGAAILTAILTAFHMFRLLFLTFYGSPRMEPETEGHIHESPKVMTTPLIILAVLAFIGGYIGLPKALGGGNWFEKFLEPVFAGGHIQSPETIVSSHSMEYVLLLFSVIAAGIGIWLAYHYYIADPESPKNLARRHSGIYNLVLNKYYIDEFYNAAFVQPLIFMALFFWKIADVRLVDGLANGIAGFFGWFSSKFRFIQTGLVRNYALIFMIGVIFLLGYIILR